MNVAIGPGPRKGPHSAGDGASPFPAELRRVLLVAFIVTVVAARPALAQEGDVVHITSPGARAAAMGRAFIGVADDASAAITNPAGLDQLTKPQFYVELRSSPVCFDSQCDQVGRANSFSFGSVSTPIGQRFAAGIVYHEPANDGLGDRFYSVGGTIAAELAPQVRVGVTVSADCTSVVDVPCARGVIGGVLLSPRPELGIGFVAGRNFDGIERFGGGVGIRPTGKVLVAFDAMELRISQQSFVENAAEVHGGVEYQIVANPQRTIFLRGGAYARTSGLFGGSQHAATFGVGYVAGRSVQVDFAADTTKDVLVSFAVRFAK